VHDDGSKGSFVDPNRGNIPLALSAIHEKVKGSIELLLAYSAKLGLMDDKRFIKAEKIKTDLFTGGDMRQLLSNIISDTSTPWDRRLELAESMFDISSRFILAGLDKDSKHQKNIVEPISAAREKLIEIVNEVRYNRELEQSREQLQRKQAQINRIIAFKGLPKRYNVMCHFCARTNDDETLLLAIHGVRHEDDCKFKNDENKPVEEIDQILAHYAREPPLQMQDENKENQEPAKKRGAKPKY
jgi:hypothetical protein